MYFSRILVKSLWRSVASRRIDDQSPAKAPKEDEEAKLKAEQDAKAEKDAKDEFDTPPEAEGDEDEGEDMDEAELPT